MGVGVGGKLNLEPCNLASVVYSYWLHSYCNIVGIEILLILLHSTGRITSPVM